MKFADEFRDPAALFCNHVTIVPPIRAIRYDFGRLHRETAALVGRPTAAAHG
jgi:hypothetical protein